MEVTASVKAVRISTRKVRLVADSIRNMPIQKAIQTLQLVEKRGAPALLKVVNSAIANAVNNAKLNKDSLVIAELIVTEGPFLKRFHASTRGRIHGYKKRSSHIRVVLKEKN